MLKNFILSKRQKFAMATIILVVGIVAIRYPFLQWRFRVLIYAISASLLSLWSLKDEDFSGIEWVTLLILPVTVALSGALVFPLLPQNFLSFFTWEISADSGLILGLGIKLGFLALFAVGYYAALLTSNIYNVAAERTIQLLRAAHAVGFILKLFCTLALNLVVAVMHLGGEWNFLLTFVASFPLVLVSLWTINLDRKVGQRTIVFTALISFCLGQIAWGLSFLPVSLSLYALTLAAAFYAAVGLAQLVFDDRLNINTGREFIFVLVAVLVLLLGSVFLWV